MAQSQAGGHYDPVAVEDYRRQARDFLVKGRERPALGDLHQASEKGWGAAAHTAKAVAAAQGWEYERHEQFNVVLDNARRLTGNRRLVTLHRSANDLHKNFYARKRSLDAGSVRHKLEHMAELLDILEPLTNPGGQE